MTAKSDFLLSDIADLVTLAPLAAQQKISGIQESDLGRLSNAWLAIEKGRIAGFGSGDIPGAFRTFPRRSAGMKLVTPGFVDAHTHAIYGGSRALEFAKRLNGETYQSIAAAGGGIKYSVRKTREASAETLQEHLRKQLGRFLSFGVTTVEVKSGYGLNVAEELKILQCIDAVADAMPQKIVATCLALHARMPEFADNASFVKEMTEKLLPEVAKSKLATYVDAFVEKGYFEVSEVEPYIQKAKELGLSVRIHADEFQDSSAALAAARWGAHSADHLECASADGIKAMADAKVVAILLPGTSLYTKIPYAKAERLRNAGVGIALSTDFNPGSCQIDNINLIAAVGALHCGLTLPETIAAVTYVPAYSLRLHESKGSLAIGADADFCIHSFASLEDWVADIGRHPPERVFIDGCVV